MKKRVLSLLLVMVMVLGLLPTGVLAAEGATEVSSQEGLAGMTDSGSYVLTQDITLNEWTAIDFSGTLDGNGHTITLAGQSLFNELTGSVQNLLLDGVVDYSDSAVGALAVTINNGTVDNCWSGTGYDGWETFAGFVGTMSGGTIKNCLFATDGYADYGIAAEADSGSVIENCYYSSGYDVSEGSFMGDGNEKISAGQYPYAMAQLNAAHEAGLLYWAMDTDGIPKPISSDEPEADRSELEELYNTVKDKENTVPGEEGVTYTSESWDAFVTARDKAKAVLDNPEATQASIDAAKEALQAAIDGLTPDRSGTTEEQRSTLQALISSAPTEKGSYAMLGRTVSDTGGDQYSCRPCVGRLAW